LWYGQDSIPDITLLKWEDKNTYLGMSTRPSSFLSVLGGFIRQLRGGLEGLPAVFMEDLTPFTHSHRNLT